MKPVRANPFLRIAGIGLGLVALESGSWPADARGDGGTLQLAKETSGYRISVFTSPTPIRVGLLDTSVFVQDAETGNPIGEAGISIHVVRRAQPTRPIDATATREAATNKLLQAAVLTLTSPGWSEIVVQVDGPHGPAQVRFEVEVAEPLPPWRLLWPWFSWPAAVVLLFGAQQLLVHRRTG